MHDAMMLIMGCRGEFSDVATNPAHITSKSLNRVSAFSFGAKEQG